MHPDPKICVWPTDDFIFPVKAMAIVLRAKYLQVLKKLIDNSDATLLPHPDILEIISHLYSKDWVVYAKRPFGGPQQVIEYLGRYTHNLSRLAVKYPSLTIESKKRY